MKAHKNAGMIKAKADNMDLVVFAKSLKWHEVDSEDFQFFNQHDEYFLCLPQHKEACLHWLNWGDVQISIISANIDWSEYHSCIDGWDPDLSWMDESAGFRIKPRKEKLWIAVKTDKHENLGGCRKVRICSHAFVNKSDAEEYLDLSGSKLIEIEVEV